MERNIILNLALFLIIANSGFSQSTGNYIAREFISNNDTLPYRILYPVGYDESGKYPVIFFLHGSGERGNDNLKHLVHGSALFNSPETRLNYPAIVIFPQCSEDGFWSNVVVTYHKNGVRDFWFPPEDVPTNEMTLLLGLVDSITNGHDIDKSRVYIGGLSMGGMGTFEILARRPDLFAAGFPICGGGNPSHTHKYSGLVSLWIFHGLDDNVVPANLSIEMERSIKDHGGDVKLTLYEGVGHNSWDNAFNEPTLLPWLFSNRRIK